MRLSSRFLPFGLALVGCAFAWVGHATSQDKDYLNMPLGLPALPVPEDNSMSPEKVALGETLFFDARFSKTGEVSCSTCHDPAKAFTDNLKVSEGIDKLTGTRNAPTVINAAFLDSQFWDGREGTLESQSLQPFINPVEMGLEDHQPILDVVRDDEDYGEAFKAVFGVSGDDITIDHVAKAIAAFERTIVSGNSPFDRWRFAGEEAAISDQAKRGFELYIGKARCVSCHTVQENFALFTDNRFHNLNVNFARISDGLDNLRATLAEQVEAGRSVDDLVLTDADLSELGRYAVSTAAADIGGFKTPTLRNIAVTAPYMHDGSLETLEDVMNFYNLGGRVNEGDPINDFQSSGIRPLDLTEEEVADVVAFLETLTSPEFAQEEDSP